MVHQGKHWREMGQSGRVLHTSLVCLPVQWVWDKHPAWRSGGGSAHPRLAGSRPEGQGQPIDGQWRCRPQLLVGSQLRPGAVPARPVSLCRDGLLQGAALGTLYAAGGLGAG